jgi:hypothetical protein
MFNSDLQKDYGTGPERIPVRDQQEENPKETEKGQSEKKDWPPKDKS